MFPENFTELNTTAAPTVINIKNLIEEVSDKVEKKLSAIQRNLFKIISVSKLYDIHHWKSQRVIIKDKDLKKIEL